MTPTATYIAEENCLQTLPEMKKPELPEGRSGERDKEIYYHAMANYNTHVATLRKIPCSPSCKGLWADGQKLVDGKDYPIPAMLPTDPKFIAFPLVPVKSEDELWEEVEKLITVNSNWQIPEIIRIVKMLKQKYSLTKR